MLEPYDVKLSRTVLRREWDGNAPDLSGGDGVIRVNYHVIIFQNSIYIPSS